MNAGKQSLKQLHIPSGSKFLRAEIFQMNLETFDKTITDLTELFSGRVAEGNYIVHVLEFIRVFQWMRLSKRRVPQQQRLVLYRSPRMKKGGGKQRRQNLQEVAVERAFVSGLHARAQIQPQLLQLQEHTIHTLLQLQFSTGIWTGVCGQ